MEPLSKYIVTGEKNQTILVAFTLICFSYKCDTANKFINKKMYVLFTGIYIYIYIYRYIYIYIFFFFFFV